MMHPNKLDQETRDAIHLHKAVEWLPFEWNGPLIRKPDGGLIGIGPDDAFESADGGRTWEKWPLFTYGTYDKEVKISNEPGELWLTTMQGGLAVRLRERDFVA